VRGAPRAACRDVRIRRDGRMGWWLIPDLRAPG